MNKIIKYLVYAVLVVIVLILSVDIKNLDEVRASETNEEFNAAEYAQRFWRNQRSASVDDAVDLSELLEQLKNNFENTAELGRSVGISNYRYFLVKGTGTITDISEDDIVLEMESSDKVLLAKGFIFGNTVRNAIPQIEIGDFVNMTQFNQVSIEINKLVEENIIPELVSGVEKGRTLDFAGAISVNVEGMNLDSLRVIPLQINFTD